jgi:hypothetical protein
MSRCTIGINDTGSKFATPNFGTSSTGVVDISGKQWEQNQTADNLKT